MCEFYVSHNFERLKRKYQAARIYREYEC